MEFKFKKQPKEQWYSESDFYALCNGYLVPEEILADEDQAATIHDAASLLESFFYEAREAGAIGEM